jgi:quinolinate synthase
MVHFIRLGEIILTETGYYSMNETQVIQQILALKQKRKAVILAHTYQPAPIQDLADYVGDSYGLSVEATKTPAETIVFCGVTFMAETAAILNPGIRVLLPEPTAGCPMADMITPGDLVDLKAQHPQYLVVCYVNSSAEIKALSDVCCTSSNAVAIVKKLPAEKGLIFVPDKYLGSFVKAQTGRNMVLWDGFCPTHLRITPALMRAARQQHPHAVIMIHPEAEDACRELADVVLSTGGMARYAAESKAGEFVIATENGLLHYLRKNNPGKIFYEVSDTVTCPNMKKTTLHSVLNALEGSGGITVSVPPNIAKKARKALTVMLELSV